MFALVEELVDRIAGGGGEAEGGISEFVEVNEDSPLSALKILSRNLTPQLYSPGII